jgi:hypothetical protein
VAASARVRRSASPRLSPARRLRTRANDDIDRRDYCRVSRGEVLALVDHVAEDRGPYAESSWQRATLANGARPTERNLAVALRNMCMVALGIVRITAGGTSIAIVRGPGNKGWGGTTFWDMDQEQEMRIASLKAEEEERWEGCGRELADEFADRSWGSLDFFQRVAYLEEIHQRLRLVFGLTRETRIAFVDDIDGERTGMGYDDETGKYIVVAIDEVRAGRENSTGLVAGLAHELRHAYQHEARQGLHPDEPRADFWRETYRGSDVRAEGYDHHPLELDARAAESAVGFGFTHAD